MPLKAVLRKHQGAVVESMLFSWLLAASIVTMILMTPTLIQKLYAITPSDALAANSVATLALTLGCIVSGWLVDRIGTGRFFTLGSPLLGGMAWLFYVQVKADPSALVAWYALAGLSVGVIGAVPFVMIKAFPPAVRFSGLSFSYNVAYAIFGGLTPIVVSLWLPLNPMAPAHYVAGVSVIGFLLGSRSWLRSRQNAR